MYETRARIRGGDEVRSLPCLFFTPTIAQPVPPYGSHGTFLPSSFSPLSCRLGSDAEPPPPVDNGSLRTIVAG